MWTISKTLLSLTLAFFFLNSAAFGADYSEKTLELYEKSGLAKQTLAMSNAAVASIAQIKDQLASNADTPDIFDELAAVVEDAYSPDLLRETFLTHLAALNAQDTAATLAWLTSPAGTRVAQLEEESSEYRSQTAIDAYAANLASVPPDPEYLNKIHQLMKLLDVTTLSVDLIANSQLVMSAAALAVSGTYNVDLLPELEAEINSARPFLEEPVRKQITVSFLYTYHSLAPEELQAYLDFLSSPAGRRYSIAAYNGFQKAILKASRRLGKSIGEALRSERLKRPA